MLGFNAAGKEGAALREIGVYIHVPFCDGKCPYCDFYSLRGDESLMDRYARSVERAMAREGSEDLEVKTLYFGGGTPSLLGAGRLERLLEAAARHFSLSPEAEITLEANPTRVDEGFFHDVRRAGFNRLSMGLQSANQDELEFLGRKHTASDAAGAVEAARAGGFQNISLDLMLGLPGEGAPEERKRKLLKSVEFAAGLQVQHISAYILKVEEGTPFAARGVCPPGDDETADQYLFCVSELEKRGFIQYEISNFAKPGRESRHNLRYWRGQEYLGFGPGAHSFYRGKRFFYPRDLSAFLEGNFPCPDGEGGSFEEYAMLTLRLTEGLCRWECERRFGDAGEKGFEAVLKKAKSCPPQLVRADSLHIAFTPEGFLVSNALLVRLLS